MKIRVFEIALLAIVGCVTSRSPDFPDYNRNLSEGKEKKSISYSISRTASLSVSKNFDPNSSPWVLTGAYASPQPLEVLEAQFFSIFEDAATSFTRISNKSQSEADITLHINQQNCWNYLSLFPAIIGGASWGIIPSWADDVYYLKANVTNRYGLKKEYLIMRDITTTVWLPLIFAMPFSESPGFARDTITAENWKELRFKMEADGFFDKLGK